MSVSISEGIHAQMQYDCTDDTGTCWCRGSGWIVSDWDSYHRCPVHYDGQLHPEASEEEWEYYFSNEKGDQQFLITEEPWTSYEDEWMYHVAHLLEVEMMKDIPF